MLTKGRSHDSKYYNYILILCGDPKNMHSFLFIFSLAKAMLLIIFTNHMVPYPSFVNYFLYLHFRLATTSTNQQYFIQEICFFPFAITLREKLNCPKLLLGITKRIENKGIVPRSTTRDLSFFHP